MRSQSGKLGEFVMTLLLLVIGGGLIYGNVWDRDVGELITNALNVPIVAAGVGAILILSVLLRWLGGCRKKKDSYIDFQSEDGSVGVSTKAIQEFIERVGKEFAAIKSIESKLIQNKGTLDIAIGVRVLSGNKIPELSQVLQQRIRESVRESLGLEELGRISIQIKEIIGSPDKRPDNTELSSV